MERISHIPRYYGEVERMASGGKTLEEIKHILYARKTSGARDRRKPACKKRIRLAIRFWQETHAPIEQQ